MNVSLGLAFLSGIASTVSPCVLPFLPTFLSWVTGVAVHDAIHHHRRLADRLAFFSTGLILTFVASGVAAGSIGAALKQQTWVLPAAGMVFILWGLFLIGFLHLPHMRVRMPKPEQTGRLGAFFFGVLFTITWTPCIGPIYGTILTLAAASGSALSGGTLLLAYALGLAVPLLAIGFAANTVLKHLKKFAPFQHRIRQVVGWIVVVIGVLLLTGVYSMLIGWVSERFVSYIPPLA